MHAVRLLVMAFLYDSLPDRRRHQADRFSPGQHVPLGRCGMFRMLCLVYFVGMSVFSS